MGVTCFSVVGAKRVARQGVNVQKVASVVALCVNVKGPAQIMKCRSSMISNIFDVIYLDLQCPHKYMYDLKPLLREIGLIFLRNSPVITV